MSKFVVAGKNIFKEFDSLKDASKYVQSCANGVVLSIYTGEDFDRNKRYEVNENEKDSEKNSNINR